MEYGIGKVIVANTFTSNKEVQTYVDLAIKYNYTYFSIVLENRSNTKNIHDVPTESLEKQKKKLLNNIIL